MQNFDAFYEQVARFPLDESKRRLARFDPNQYGRLAGLTRGVDEFLGPMGFQETTPGVMSVNG